MSATSELHYQAWIVLGLFVTSPFCVHISLNWGDNKQINLRKISHVILPIEFIILLGFVVLPTLIEISFALEIKDPQKVARATVWYFLLIPVILMIAYESIKDMLKCK